MVWCGYHPDMGGGIEQFGRGIVSSIEAKAKAGGVSIGSQIATEQDQLFLLENLLATYDGKNSRSEDDALRFRALAALVVVSRYLIGSDARPQKSVEAFLNQVVGRSGILASLIAGLDSEFEKLTADEASHCSRLRIALTKSGILKSE